jgi:hypothetical protein
MVATRPRIKRFRKDPGETRDPLKIPSDISAMAKTINVNLHSGPGPSAKNSHRAMCSAFFGLIRLSSVLTGLQVAHFQNGEYSIFGNAGAPDES